MIFVKGTTLSVLAYGAIGVKSAKDIDLLAPHEDFLRACQVLTSLGYERRTPEPELSDAQFRRFMRHSHEAMFVHPGLGMVVDIHPSLVENPLLLPDLGLASPRQTVRISDGIELPTLALGPLFSYLCVHGAIHHWKRLKWLADVAALIGSDTAEIESLYREAVALGAGRCPAVALLLCHELLGTPLSPGFHEELKRDLNVTRLLKVSRFMIAGNKHDVNFDKRPATNLQIMQGNFLLASGWAYVLAELRHHAFYPGDRVLLAAPAFLRPLVRLLTLPGRWVRRIFLPAV